MYFLVKSLALFGDLRQTINRNKFRLTSEDCAKSFTYINKMPWGYANYESKKKDHLGPNPCTLH